jgi:hypothetical protein
VTPAAFCDGHVPQPNIDLSQCDLGDRYVEFVPMIWGADSVDGFVAKVRPYVLHLFCSEPTSPRCGVLVTQLPKNTKHLLGFNEPNIPGQAVMTPLVRPPPRFSQAVLCPIRISTHHFLWVLEHRKPRPSGRR